MEPESASSSTPAPPAASILFARGVIARLAIWPALKVAVAENWGGPNGVQKRTWLASVIVDAFEETKDPSPDVYYVEDMLLQVMSDEFETELEDGSSEGVAKDIVQLWEDAQAGKTQLMEQLEERAEKMKGKKIEFEQGVASDEEEWSDDEDADEESDTEAPQLVQRDQPRQREEPEVDEDGFTLVKGKSRNR